MTNFHLSSSFCLSADVVLQKNQINSQHMVSTSNDVCLHVPTHMQKCVCSCMLAVTSYTCMCNIYINVCVNKRETAGNKEHERMC